ncbi:MAG TPA: L-lactate dehydrogenase [Candidatus Pacebacteria bacterium]|nr:L-lactate dehydrogenase [Candidatus Paceibacterota bacterium]
MNHRINQDLNKVAIIGCGKVGMTAAYALLLKNVVNELVLIGRSQAELTGEQLDLEHGLNFLGAAKIFSSINYEDMAKSDVVVITAGVAQKPGETRLDLTVKNLAIIEEIIPKIVQYAPEAVIVIVSNPVDILTYRAYQIAGLPKGRIFGTGTMLDSARFRFHLSEFLKVNPRSIHAYVLGEHGDSSFPALSSAIVGGQSLLSLPNFSETKALAAFEATRSAAYKIIAAKGATYYAIGTVISQVVEHILRDSRRVLSLSIPLHGYHDYYGVALSVPCVLGRSGVEQALEIKLSWEEKLKLAHSVETLKKYLPKTPA